MADCQHCVPCSLQRMEETLHRMEINMANEVEQLNVIKAKLTDVHADVRAKLEQVRAETSPEGQAALDEVVSAIESFDAEIGDANASDTPAGGGTTPAEPADGDDTGDDTGEGPAGGSSAGVPA